MQGVGVIVEWLVARIVLRYPHVSRLSPDVLRAVLRLEGFAQLSDGSIVEVEASYPTEREAREHKSHALRMEARADLLIVFHTDATV